MVFIDKLTCVCILHLAGEILRHATEKIPQSCLRKRNRGQIETLHNRVQVRGRQGCVPKILFAYVGEAIDTSAVAIDGCRGDDDR